jgi:hypothetical protein
MTYRTFKQLSSAEQVERLVALIMPLVEPMARLLTMLGGAKMPELVLERSSEDGSKSLEGYGDELRDFMLLVKESLEMGKQPVGLVYESVNGFERIPLKPGDQSQIDLLERYLRSKDGEPKDSISAI